MIEFAREIAQGAGSILMERFRSGGLEISYKSRTDLVTDADRTSEDFLVSSISSRFPDHSIIAEEGGGTAKGAGFIWYVDPLDGTNNFAHGLPIFAVSIGIYSMNEGHVVGGVVFNPYMGEMFHAARGAGAYCNGAPIRVSSLRDIGVSIVATGFPYDKAVSDNNNLREFNRILPRVQGIRRMGSAAIDLCYVGCGRLDAYWECKLKPWDTAAGSIVVEEAGGRVTRYNGEEYQPEFPEIAASNGQVHSQLIELLHD